MTMFCIMSVRKLQHNGRGTYDLKLSSLIGDASIGKHVTEEVGRNIIACIESVGVPTRLGNVTTGLTASHCDNRDGECKHYTSSSSASLDKL